MADGAWLMEEGDFQIWIPAFAGMTVEGFGGATGARISIRQRKSLTGWRSVD
jgi:hypothetical protein